MSPAIQSWNVTDLARAAKVSTDQIDEWIEAGLLNATVNERGRISLPIIESVAAMALRDGKDPQAARDELMQGREIFSLPQQHDRLTPEQLEELHQSFLVKHRLPQPENPGLPLDDPREEAI